MDFLIKYGKRVAVLRPDDPQAAIAHALKAQRTQTWSNFPGKTTFVGYMAGDGRKVLDTEGVVIGSIKPGDVFAAPPDEEKN
jgi:hypothetical protein